MRRREVAISIAAVVLLWAGFAYDLTRPVDARGYHRTVLQVAEAAQDATQTGRLTGEQQLAGNVTGPFARAAFDDASRALAGAQQQFAGQGPPDRASAELRDRLTPLLADSVLALGDTARSATDPDRHRPGREGGQRGAPVGGPRVAARPAAGVLAARPPDRPYPGSPP
ncbi:hypothetical protein [Paractinoplanes toevensis]|uniref:Uncharacterized protein n=1 Tax=Paractinoplanes toevensis TaxID=571911 RepID=A0A919W7X7_9ACTN|nr:hypothetical protein [Actinoplanes toevensis]GIM90921.1 hypothetical protein Ato02nite_027140 [Actinoplanes toevensis]